MIAPASLPDTESSPFVRSIGDVGCRDLRVAGCHGASLCEILEAGLPVAPGFVVTAQAFMFAMEHAGVAAMLRDGVRLALIGAIKARLRLIGRSRPPPP